MRLSGAGMGDGRERPGHAFIHLFKHVDGQLLGARSSLVPGSQHTCLWGGAHSLGWRQDSVGSRGGPGSTLDSGWSVAGKAAWRRGGNGKGVWASGAQGFGGGCAKDEESNLQVCSFIPVKLREEESLLRYPGMEGVRNTPLGGHRVMHHSGQAWGMGEWALWVPGWAERLGPLCRM